MYMYIDNKTELIWNIYSWKLQTSKCILTAYLIDFRKTDIWSSKLIWDTEFFKKKRKKTFFIKVDRYEKHKQYACAHQRSFTVIQYTIIKTLYMM